MLHSKILVNLFLHVLKTNLFRSESHETFLSSLLNKTKMLLSFSGYNLMKAYQKDHLVKRIVKLYLAWPNLPLADMRPQLKYIRKQIRFVDKKIRPRLKDFHHSYFCKTWLRKITPERVCEFACMKRTTNDLENLHGRMGSRLPKRPGFLRFHDNLNNKIIKPSNIRSHFDKLGDNPYPRKKRAEARAK